jgi:hypothetical protein
LPEPLAVFAFMLSNAKPDATLVDDKTLFNDKNNKGLFFLL